MKTTNHEEIELDRINIILPIPKETVSMELTVKIMHGDIIQTVGKQYTIGDIHDMRQDFLDNVEFGDDYNAMYEITEEGERYLEEREHEDNT